MEQFDRITTNVARLNGEPCIRDLRLTVRRVLEALAIYPDRAELKREYPELEDEDIRKRWPSQLPWWMTRSCPWRRHDEVSA